MRSSRYGIYALTLVWPSGWAWHTGYTSHYLQMILLFYATLGIFLSIASRKPLAHLSLIWFTVWSSCCTPESWGPVSGEP